jgi:hypothetical protein
MSKKLPIKKTDLHALADKWPSPLVSRGSVEKFTGGIINSKTLANMDCQGTGPGGRVRVGRKIAYRVDALISWLQDRAEAID